MQEHSGSHSLFPSFTTLLQGMVLIPSDPHNLSSECICQFCCCTCVFSFLLLALFLPGAWLLRVSSMSQQLQHQLEAWEKCRYSLPDFLDQNLHLTKVPDGLLHFKVEETFYSRCLHRRAVLVQRRERLI